MRHLIACLFALLCTACQGSSATTHHVDPDGDGTASVADGPQPRGADALQPDPAPSTGFSKAHDPRGPAWSWDQDPRLRVVLFHGHDSHGLRIEFDGDALVSGPADADGGDRLPVVLVWPRSDGTPPLAADDSPGLHLLLAGSAEHGCPTDDLELDLLPSWTDDGLQLDITFDGIPYMTLPQVGRILSVDSQGQHVTDPQDLVTGRTSFEHDGFQRLKAVGTPLGTVELWVDEPLPWLQLQGHDSFVEVDVDHSCEEPGFDMHPRIHLRAWL